MLLELKGKYRNIKIDPFLKWKNLVIKMPKLNYWLKINFSTKAKYFDF